MRKPHREDGETGSDQDGRRCQATDASQAATESGSSQEHAQRYWTFVGVSRNRAEDNKADRKGEDPNPCVPYSLLGHRSVAFPDRPRRREEHPARGMGNG